MTAERLNRWLENVVRWYRAAELRTVLILEWVADSGCAFLIVVFCGVLLIALTTWVVKG